MPLFAPSPPTRLDFPTSTVQIVKSHDGTRKLIFQTKNHKQVLPLLSTDIPPDYPTNRLWLVRLDQKAKPFIIANLLTEPTSGGDHSIAYVFHLYPNKLKLIGGLWSNQEIRAIHRPGGGELLVRSYEIGYQMAHAFMPRWEELFYVRHNHIHQLKHAKWFYQPWAGELWDALKQYPDDLDIWAHYGLALTYSRTPKSPTRELRRLKQILLHSVHPDLAHQVPHFHSWPKPESSSPYGY